MITINTKTLLKCIKQCNKIKNISTLDICDTVHLSVTDDCKLKVYRFCLDIQYTETIEINASDNHLFNKPNKKYTGDFKPICINVVELQKILSGCEEEINLETKDDFLLIKGKYDFSLTGYDQESFRHVNIDIKTKPTLVPWKTLKWIKEFMCMDENRFTLNGIYFDASLGNVVATNGVSLGVWYNPGYEIETGGIVPKEVIKLLTGENSFSFDSEKVYIQTETGMYMSKLIEGSYPNYAQIMPKYTDKESFNFNATIEFIKDSLMMIKDSDLIITSKEMIVSNNKMNMTIELDNPELQSNTLFPNGIAFSRELLLNCIYDTTGKFKCVDSFKPVVWCNGTHYSVVMPKRNPKQ